MTARLGWLVEQVAAEARAAQAAVPDAECDWCGADYHRRHVVQRYCGARCQRAAAEHKRGTSTATEAAGDPIWAERAEQLRGYLPGTYREIRSRLGKVMSAACVMNTLAWGDGTVFLSENGVWRAK